MWNVIWNYQFILTQFLMNKSVSKLLVPINLQFLFSWFANSMFMFILLQLRLNVISLKLVKWKFSAKTYAHIWCNECSSLANALSFVHFSTWQWFLNRIKYSHINITNASDTIRITDLLHIHSHYIYLVRFAKWFVWQLKDRC